MMGSITSWASEIRSISPTLFQEISLKVLVQSLANIVIKLTYVNTIIYFVVLDKLITRRYMGTSQLIPSITLAQFLNLLQLKCLGQRLVLQLFSLENSLSVAYLYLLTLFQLIKITILRFKRVLLISSLIYYFFSGDFLLGSLASLSLCFNN